MNQISLMNKKEMMIMKTSPHISYLVIEERSDEICISFQFIMYKKLYIYFNNNI